MDRKGPWAAAQGGTRRRYTDQSIGAESIHFRIQLSLFCRLEQPVQPFSGWWTARSLHADPHLVHTARRRHHMDQPDGLCLCGRGGQFAVQRIIEQDEMSV